MDISVNFKGGGSFVKLKPVFSKNGENIFVASKDSIIEYHTKTGKQIYEYKGFKGYIQAFSCNIINGFECLVACSNDGHVIVWKIALKIRLFEGRIQAKQVRAFHLISYNLKDGLDIFFVYKKKNKVCCTTINMKNPEYQKTLITLNSGKCAIDVCQNKYFAVVQKNEVHFYNFENNKYRRYNMEKNNRTFTCISCHPQEEIVLTGDNTGRVLVWQNIFEKPSQAVFHWHTLPVKCVAFSTLGSYFYSGADECVLVKWTLDNPNQKLFLPRLPAGICHISVSENSAYIALGTSDNAVRIVDSRMNQVTVIQHLVFGNQFESGITYDPISRALVLNGNVGCVQFFSPSDCSLLYNIDIVSQNKITNERDLQISNTEVIKVALSKSGKWLATVEERREDKVCKEIRLKFWNFSSEKQTYQLNTSVEDPHKGSIKDIAFQPVSTDDNIKFVTIGDDKTFRIWELANSSDTKKPMWSCPGMGFFRGLSCNGLCFSVDGSLFATGFNSILTAWTPDGCQLKCALNHPSFKENIKFIQFGQANQCHLVVAASESQLCVWNLLTLSMSWIVNLNAINLLVKDNLSTYMAVVCDKSEVFIFEPISSNIVYSSEKILKGNEKIVAATFIPSKNSNDTRLKWYERSNLYIVNSKSELFCVSRREEPYEYTDNFEDLSEDMSVFSKLKPKTKTTDVREDAFKSHMFPKDIGCKTYKQYLEAPILTLPPIRLMAASLINSLVIQKDDNLV